MIYKGMHQKKLVIVELTVLLSISLIVASIIERFLAVKEVNIGTLLYYLISAIIKIITAIFFSIIYFTFIKKNPSEDSKKD